jgi:hypothetical protein
VKGQDAGTLPPGIEPSQELEIFIDLMCRTIKLEFEKVIRKVNYSFNSKPGAQCEGFGKVVLPFSERRGNPLTNFMARLIYL